MNLDLLDKLAEMEVPPPPPQFDRQIHERLNRSLLVQHTLDFALGALPLAMAHFGRAVLALLSYSLLGSYGDRQERTDNS